MRGEEKLDKNQDEVKRGWTALVRVGSGSGLGLQCHLLLPSSLALQRALFTKGAVQSRRVDGLHNWQKVAREEPDLECNVSVGCKRS